MPLLFAIVPAGTNRRESFTSALRVTKQLSRAVGGALAVIAIVSITLDAQPLTQDLYLRLLSPLDSTARSGTTFSAVVTGCVHAGCNPVLPPGSRVAGHLKQARPVGVGLHRERASLALAFDYCLLPDGAAKDCAVDLVDVDNARETVTADGRIRGILAASHPHSFLGGLWVRPSSALFPRAVSGVTGAGRMIYNGLADHPAVAGAVLLSRLAFLRLPEPEIHFAPGTELIAEITASPHGANAEAHPTEVDTATAVWLSGLPIEVTLPDGKPAADILNLAFHGSREQVVNAFQSAGWTTADPLNRRSMARSYRAFTSLKPYPTAPVSPLLYQQRLPDLVFQKSLNTMDERHHIRIWELQSPAGPVWVGAATHDIGVIFEWNRLSMNHRIDREIDRERDKVLTDLDFAGCVEQYARLARPSAASGSGQRITDGSLFLLETRACTPGAVESTKRRRLNPLKAAIRHTILETRHYILRGNGYYWAWKGLRPQRIVSRMRVGKPNTEVSWRRGSESNRRMRVLQTLALPLGYRAPR
jgi:hypothetical protein